MFELVTRIQIAAECANGTAEIAADHPALRDHFPGRPIVPGTWLVELAAQIAGPLVEEATRARHALERWALLAMIQHAKLLAPVTLPAVVEIEATLARSELATATARVVARSAGELVLRAELVFALVEAPDDCGEAIRERRERLERWKAAW